MSAACGGCDRARTFAARRVGVVESAASRLVLGTAQFGSDYGVTNAVGRVPDAELSEILSTAIELGISRLDTALEYGDAQARLQPWVEHFTITTKVRGAAGIGPSVGQCLEQLGVTSIDEVLIHDWATLDGDARVTAADALASLRDDGVVHSVGVSVYDEHEIDEALTAFPALDSVQAPVNVLDQRLAGSVAVSSLHSNGGVLQARSVLLQGLLVSAPTSFHTPSPSTPGSTGTSSAAALHRDVECFQSFCSSAGVSPLAGAVRFVAALPWVDELVIGVTSAAELHEIVEALSSVPQGWVQACAGLASVDASLIDPRQWGK